MRKPFNTPKPFGILLPAAEAAANPPFVNWFPAGQLVQRCVRRASLRDLSELTVEDEVITREPAKISFLLHSVYPMVWDSGEKTLRIRGEKYELMGKLETSEPVDATISTAFDHECNTRSALLDTFDEYPDQYHLEMKMARAVRQWNPRMVFTWRRL